MEKQKIIWGTVGKIKKIEDHILLEVASTEGFLLGQEIVLTDENKDPLVNTYIQEILEETEGRVTIRVPIYVEAFLTGIRYLRSEKQELRYPEKSYYRYKRRRYYEGILCLITISGIFSVSIVNKDLWISVLAIPVLILFFFHYYRFQRSEKSSPIVWIFPNSIYYMEKENEKYLLAHCNPDTFGEEVKKVAEDEKGFRLFLSDRVIAYEIPKYMENGLKKELLSRSSRGLKK